MRGIIPLYSPPSVPRHPKSKEMRNPIKKIPNTILKIPNHRFSPPSVPRRKLRELYT